MIASRNMGLLRCCCMPPATSTATASFSRVHVVVQRRREQGVQQSRGMLSTEARHLPWTIPVFNQTYHSVLRGQQCRRDQVRCFAQPRKKLPDRSVDIKCSKCDTLLYKYRKGGKGSLVKCYVERITQDFTDGNLACPKCGISFAREATIHGRPAHKIIGGKVYTK